jgi:hypothetical protein
MRQTRQDMGGRQRGDDDAMILPTWTVLSLHVTDPSCYLRVLGEGGHLSAEYLHVDVVVAERH